MKKTSFTNTPSTNRESLHFDLNIRLPPTDVTVNVTNTLEVLMILLLKRQISKLKYSPVSLREEDLTADIVTCP